MKRCVIFVSLFLLFTSVYAFEQGTINLGGNIGFSSYKSNSDDDDSETTISIAPNGGYFFIDNISGDLMINFSNATEGDYKSSRLQIGFGGRYFINQMYAGLGFMMGSGSSDSEVGETELSANFLNLKAGYLMPLAENVYVDLGLDYLMGIGEYGGDREGDNEESKFEVKAGLQIFLKK